MKGLFVFPTLVFKSTYLSMSSQMHIRNIFCS
jgi:hypothetical protein